MQQEYLTKEQKRSKMIKGIVSLVAVLAGFGLAAWGIAYLAKQDSGIQTLTPSISEISSDEYVWGDPNASVTLLEYGDFQCPACRAAAPHIKKLHEEFPDKLKIVFRHFPLSQHKNAFPASYAAEAAGLQGKFWEMNELLFTNQPSWADLANPQTQFDLYAQQLGLDIEKFRGDYSSTDVRNKVKAHQNSGAEAGVNSTPTFFINGEKIANPSSYEQFRTLITNAIK